jgi:hypothetical protein
MLAFGMELLANRTSRQVAGIIIDIDGASNIATSTKSVLVGSGESVLKQLVLIAVANHDPSFYLRRWGSLGLVLFSAREFFSLSTAPKAKSSMK